MRRTGFILSALLACTDRPIDETDASSTTADPGTTQSPAVPTSEGTVADNTAADTTAADATAAATTTSTSTSDASTSSSTTTTASTTGDAPALECPPALDAAIAACVAELQADPELGDNTFLLDLLFACSDAEPVADDYDAHCAESPDDPICALDYRTFVTEVLPMCIARVQDVLFADVCLLPETYKTLLFTPGIALMQRRQLTSAAELTDPEREQLMRTSAELGLPVADADEAVLATDDGRIEQLVVLDVGTDRAFALYVGRYQSVLRGRGFFRGTMTILGAVEDGMFSRCGVERGVEGQPCADDVPCLPDHQCNDVLTDENAMILAAGACIFPGPLTGEGDPCTAHDECGPANGLLCIDAMHEGDPGTCRPGWMRRSFAGNEDALTPGGITSIEILVSGVATVPTAAYLDLAIVQSAEDLLTLRLFNPTGTLSHMSQTNLQNLRLDLEPMSAPGDESAGGIWKLEIEDSSGKADGLVREVALTLDTRWD